MIFEVDKIVRYLEPLKNKLPELYNWKVNFDRLVDLGVISIEQKKYFTSLNNYTHGVELRKFLLKYYQKNEPWTGILEVDKWIVKDWGGISTGSDIRLEELLKNSVNDNFQNLLFDRIASTSKVASFMDPINCIIYDSRVAYTLNWILLSETNTTQFFPVPDGRNSKMVSFDINVLIKLGLIDKKESVFD